MGIYCTNIQLLVSVIGLTITNILFGGAVILLLLYLRKIAMQKERYDLISEQQQIVWLDYHFSPQNLKVTGDLQSLTEKKRLDLMGMEVYEIYDWVHDEDSSIHIAVRQFFETEERYFKSEFRVRHLDNSYGWYSLTGTLLKYNNGKNKRFVAKLKNVDFQMKQEKNLMQKAENDLLTGVFNKKTMEEKIREAIEERRNNQHYIFFMIDLDNFKAVNDTLGHLYGDKVLTDVSDKLKKMFTVNAMIGRLGGDEFAVCASFDAFDALNLDAYMRKKAEKIRASLKASYSNDGMTVDISASIGVAVAPEDGSDFEEIYQKADKALYLSKSSGKDCYNLYQSSHTNE